MIGESEGFTFLSVGGDGRFDGSWRDAAEIAACTSCAAASMLRSRLNCRVMATEPCVLCDVIEATSGIVRNWLSSGDAIADATVCGSAPGSDAETTMVGKSTLGSSLTGSVA